MKHLSNIPSQVISKTAAVSFKARSTAAIKKKSVLFFKIFFGLIAMFQNIQDQDN